MTSTPKTPDTSKKETKKLVLQPDKELQTDMPLSEKDEVKKAEQNTSKQGKKPI